MNRLESVLQARTQLELFAQLIHKKHQIFKQAIQKEFYNMETKYDTNSNQLPSSKKKEQINKEKVSESKANLLLDLVLSKDVELFRDDPGDKYCRVPVEEHFEIWACQSKIFKDWIAKLFWDKYNIVPPSETIKAALAILAAKAQFEGKQYSLHNRTAFLGQDIWYDLTNKSGHAVRINSDGWDLDKKPPILFKRYAHQSPHTTPQQGGDLHEILNFISLRDTSQHILLLVYIVSCLLPDIPHPIPLLYGPQGSGKTTFFRMLRSLVDPSCTPVLSFPKNSSELVQQLSHHWSPFYDNLGLISDSSSDILCRAVTGEGFTKRRNYTDDDDVIYSYRRCIGLNGIDVIVQKPDLLDRCILFELNRISPYKRQEESKLLKLFEEKKPLFLGAILTALSKAMCIYPTIKLTKLPRMADFASWGCAIAVALGYSENDFLSAYELNYQNRNKEALNANPLGSVILEFMDKRDCWKGNATQLLSDIKPIVLSQGIDTKNPNWPKAPHALSIRLNQVATNLRAMSISVETGGRVAHTRIITLQKLQTENQATSPSNQYEDVKAEPCEKPDSRKMRPKQRLTEVSLKKGKSPPMTAMTQLSLFPDLQRDAHNDTN